MISKRARCGAFVGMTTVGMLGAGLMSAVPASAAQAAQTQGAVSASHATAISGSATAANITSAVAVRKATPGHASSDAGVEIYCDVADSGLYLIQPGGYWGPYLAWYADTDAVGAAAEVTCNVPVPEITWSGDLVVNGADYDGQSASLDNVLETPWAYDMLYECWAGSWQSGGIALVTLPPGYVSITTGKPYLYLVEHSAGYNLTDDECVPDS